VFQQWRPCLSSLAFSDYFGGQLFVQIVQYYYLMDHAFVICTSHLNEQRMKIMGLSHMVHTYLYTFHGGVK